MRRMPHGAAGQAAKAMGVNNRGGGSEPWRRGVRRLAKSGTLSKDKNR